MAFRVNLADTEVGEVEAKPNGWYHVAVTDCEVKEAGENAKNPGSEYINYELTIQVGEYKNKKFWVNASLLPQALFTLKGMMQSSGKYTADQLNSGELEFEPDDLVGSHMMARNAQREYQNEMRDNIRSFKPIGEKSANVTTAKSASNSLLP